MCVALEFIFQSPVIVKDLYYARTYITRFTRKGNLRGIKVRAEIEALSFAH